MFSNIRRRDTCGWKCVIHFVKHVIKGRFRTYDQFYDFRTRPYCYTTWIPLTSRDYYHKQVGNLDHYIKFTSRILNCNTHALRRGSCCRRFLPSLYRNIWNDPRGRRIVQIDLKDSALYRICMKCGLLTKSVRSRWLHIGRFFLHYYRPRHNTIFLRETAGNPERAR